MVRLNVFIQIRDSKDAEAVKNTALELVDKSVNDPGCIDYDVYSSLTVDNHLMIIETWKDRQSLLDHQHTDHFRRLLPQLEDLATVALTVFDF